MPTLARSFNQAANIRRKWRDPDNARRFVNLLSTKGIDVAPVLVELIIRSASHESADAPPGVVRRMRSDQKSFLADARQHWMNSPLPFRRKLAAAPACGA